MKKLLYKTSVFELFLKNEIYHQEAQKVFFTYKDGVCYYVRIFCVQCLTLSTVSSSRLDPLCINFCPNVCITGNFF